MDVVLTDYSCNNLLIKWHYLDSQIRSWSKSFCFPLATFQRSTYGASSQLLAGLWINLLHSQHVTRCCTLGCSQCVPSRVPSSPRWEGSLSFKASGFSVRDRVRDRWLRWIHDIRFVIKMGSDIGQIASQNVSMCKRFYKMCTRGVYIKSYITNSTWLCGFFCMLCIMWCLILTIMS